MKAKFTSKTLAYMAMFIALQIVLQYVFKMIPGQPQGGNISIDLLPIILCSYLMGPAYGLLVGFSCTLLHFVLGLASFYGWWSVFLDYLIPITIVGAAALFKNIKTGKVTIYTGIIITMILKFVSHYLSGAWLFAEYAPEGMNPWLYSFVYNIAYCLPTLILTYIVFMVIYPRVKNRIKA